MKVGTIIKDIIHDTNEQEDAVAIYTQPQLSHPHRHHTAFINVFEKMKPFENFGQNAGIFDFFKKILAPNVKHHEYRLEALGFVKMARSKAVKMASLGLQIENSMHKVNKICSDAQKFMNEYMFGFNDHRTNKEKASLAIAATAACRNVSAMNLNFINMTASAMYQNMRDFQLALEHTEKAILGTEVYTITDINPYASKIMLEHQKNPHRLGELLKHYRKIIPDLPKPKSLGSDLPNSNIGPPMVPFRTIANDANSLIQETFL